MFGIWISFLILFGNLKSYLIFFLVMLISTISYLASRVIQIWKEETVPFFFLISFIASKINNRTLVKLMYFSRICQMNWAAMKIINQIEIFITTHDEIFHVYHKSKATIISIY